MWNYIWPLLLVVGANTFYNICAKGTPDAIHPFASLIFTYLTAAALSMALFVATSDSKNLLAEARHANWTTFAFGLAIVGLELGYINLYRAGWNVSVGPMVANTLLAVVLLAVGALLYKEILHWNQIVGALLCIGGLVLINRKF